MDSNTNDIGSFTAGCKTHERYTQCSCCSEWDKIMIKCSECPRAYHTYCHIPIPCNNSSEEKWQCTMCKDINKYVHDLKLEIDTYQIDINNISEGTTCRHIVERLLMELYCDNVRTDDFKCNPNPNIVPEYYRAINNPRSLDEVRTSLNTSIYKSLRQFLEDLNKVFFDAIIYYDFGHPRYKMAQELQMFVEEKQKLWLHTNSIEDLENISW